MYLKARGSGGVGKEFRWYNRYTIRCRLYPISIIYTIYVELWARCRYFDNTVIVYVCVIILWSNTSTNAATAVTASSQRLSQITAPFVAKIGLSTQFDSRSRVLSRTQLAAGKTRRATAYSHQFTTGSVPLPLMLRWTKRGTSHLFSKSILAVPYPPLHRHYSQA